MAVLVPKNIKMLKRRSTMVFKKFAIEDKDIIDKYLQAEGTVMADRCFATLFIWQMGYNTSYCIVDDMLVIKYENGGFGIYSAPIGFGDYQSVVRKIVEYARKTDRKFKIIDILPEKTEIFKACCDMEISEARWSWDYVYDTESMISLAGKKLHAKRNLVNRFKIDHEGRWEYRDIDFSKDREIIFGYLEKFKERSAMDDDSYSDE